MAVTAKRIFTNNWRSSLDGAVAIGAGTLDVAAGDGAGLPTLGTGEYFILAIYSVDAGGNETAREFVKVTSVTTDTLGITRAQEGTADQAWDDGDLIELRATAGNAERAEPIIASTDPGGGDTPDFSGQSWINETDNRQFLSYGTGAGEWFELPNVTEATASPYGVRAPVKRGEIVVDDTTEYAMWIGLDPTWAYGWFRVGAATLSASPYDVTAPGGINDIAVVGGNLWFCNSATLDTGWRQARTSGRPEQVVTQDSYNVNPSTIGGVFLIHAPATANGTLTLDDPAASPGLVYDFEFIFHTGASNRTLTIANSDGLSLVWLDASTAPPVAATASANEEYLITLRYNVDGNILASWNKIA